MKATSTATIDPKENQYIQTSKYSSPKENNQTPEQGI